MLHCWEIDSATFSLAHETALTPSPAVCMSHNEAADFTSDTEFTMNAEEKLKELGIELPEPPKAAGMYKLAVVSGNMLYTSGHVPLDENGKVIKGCVGKDADEDAAKAAARRSGLGILASVKQKLGSLDKVQRLVKILGLVNCTSDFSGQPGVINGCSELMRDVFGEENGIGARSAVGTNSLPLGCIVEIEAIFELKD